MRDSIITPDLLGPYHNSDSPLQVGSVQCMQFKSTDIGPCYLTEEERNARRYDVDTGEVYERDILRADLSKALTETGIKDPPKNLKKLQEMSRSRNLPVKYQKKKIQFGWVGKPKGALQILFERGWIDPTRIKEYTKKGKSSDESLSVDRLMNMQKDFLNKVTLLQYHASKLGVTLDRSPKCHPELAGEGIEYAWGLAKLLYRRSPLSDKRNKDSFRKLVYKCLSNEDVLHIHQARACSRKARQYMLMYQAVEDIKFEEIDGIEVGTLVNKYSVLESSIKLFRRLQKKKNKHRGVLDNQLSDIKALEDGVKTDDNKEHLIRYVVKKMVSL